MKKLIYSLSILFFLAGCELADLQMEDSKSIKDENASMDSYKIRGHKTNNEICEIYSRESIRAEIEAIHNGFEPEMGVEQRLNWLGHYLEWYDLGMNMVIVRPRIPMPVCPPMPRGDCNVPRIFFPNFKLTLYSSSRPKLQATIISRRRVVARSGSVEYDERNRQATITFEIIEPELIDQVGEVQVNLQTSESSMVLAADIGEGTFQ